MNETTVLNQLLENEEMATMLHGTLFPVDRFPIRSHYDKIESVGWDVLYRRDTETPLAVVSKQYNLVENRDIVTHLFPPILQQGAVLTDAQIYEDKKSVYKLRFSEISVTLENGEAINPELIIRNSYDKSCRLHILLGAFQLLCSNGLIIGKRLVEVNQRHIGETLDWDRIISDFTDATEDIEETLFTQANPLVQTRIKDQTHIVDMVEMLPQYAAEKYLDRTLKNPPETYWDLYSHLTATLTHDMEQNYTQQDLSEHAFQRVAQYV